MPVQDISIEKYWNRQMFYLEEHKMLFISYSKNWKSTKVFFLQNTVSVILSSFCCLCILLHSSVCPLGLLWCCYVWDVYWFLPSLFVYISVWSWFFLVLKIRLWIKECMYVSTRSASGVPALILEFSLRNQNMESDALEISISHYGGNYHFCSAF